MSHREFFTVASSGAEPAHADVALDDLFEAIRNERRRLILRELDRHGSPIAIRDLAANVASTLYDCERDELTRQQRKRIYVSIYQNHVPKLETMGFAEQLPGGRHNHVGATDAAAAVLAVLDEAERVTGGDDA